MARPRRRDCTAPIFTSGAHRCCAVPALVPHSRDACPASSSTQWGWGWVAQSLALQVP